MTLFTLQSRFIACALILTVAGVYAQDDASEAISEPDTAAVAVSDTTGGSEEIGVPETEEISEGKTFIELVPGAGGLDLGYKGYPWGSMISKIPSASYIDSEDFSNDSTSIVFKGNLGLEEVRMGFFYGDGGFWKLEIDYTLDRSNVDSQVKLFNKIEKNLAEVYGPPKGTSQLLNGPNSTYSDVMNVKFSRAFYRSSWNVVPVKVELILSGIAQTPSSDFPIISSTPSFMKLVYYNPDYMIVDEGDPNPDPLPSIFDIY